MDFVTGLLLSIDLKGTSYDALLVIIDRLTKIVHYKVVKTMINTLGLVDIKINIMMRYHGLSELVISNYNSLSTSKL